MTELSTGTWVLVADGEKALFLVNDGDAQDPNLNVRRIEAQDNPPTRDQAANRPGHVGESARPGGHTYGDTDWHEFEKDRFATEVADILYRQAHRGAFDRLVIVAGPAVLGTLRGALHSEVSGKVVAEISKTLTNHPIDRIEALVKQEFA